MSAQPGMREFKSLGDRLAKAEAQIAKINRSRKLQSASIGSGGITVKDGGAITFITDNGEYELTPLTILADSDRDQSVGTITSAGAKICEVSFAVPAWAGQVVLVSTGVGSASWGGGGLETLVVEIRNDPAGEDDRSNIPIDLESGEGRKAATASISTLVPTPGATVTVELWMASASSNIVGDSAQLSSLALVSP